MPQAPTSARRKRADSRPAEERVKVKLADELLKSTRLPNLGRPPKDEEEKRAVFAALVALKAARKTNEECAAALDVSERSIANYLRDPLYGELQEEAQSAAKARGHTTIAAAIDSSVETLWTLMQASTSDFVRFKAAETMLNFAGYNLPREERRSDNVGEVERALQEIMKRRAERLGGGSPTPPQVNITIHTGPHSSQDGQEGAVPVVEAALEGGAPEPVPTALLASKSGFSPVPPELARYAVPVEPGGLLPGSSASRRGREP